MSLLSQVNRKLSCEFPETLSKVKYFGSLLFLNRSPHTDVSRESS